MLIQKIYVISISQLSLLIYSQQTPFICTFYYIYNIHKSQYSFKLNRNVLQSHLRRIPTTNAIIHKMIITRTKIKLNELFFCVSIFSQVGQHFQQHLQDNESKRNPANIVNTYRKNNPEPKAIKKYALTG